MNTELSIAISGQGLYEITPDVETVVNSSGFADGLATVYIRHTSASLVIQENADPAVQRDLEAFLSRVVPEGDPRYTHVEEGADDMPAHIKGALTQTHLSIPVMHGRLALGTWQGIFLWGAPAPAEHPPGHCERAPLTMAAYSNLRIWDGIAEGYLDADSITVEGERIAAIGDSRGGRDCSGLTAIPGLIDAHVHMVLDPGSDVRRRTVGPGRRHAPAEDGDPRRSDGPCRHYDRARSRRRQLA